MKRLSFRDSKGFSLPCVFLLFGFLLSGTVAALALSGQESLGRGRINGEVVDENGRPVEDARITVENLRTGTKLEGKSDKKGHFAVAGLGTGMWRIEGSKAGYASSSLEMNVSQLQANPPITLTLKKLSGFSALKEDEAAFALFDKGNALIKEGQYDEALKLFEEFLTKYPEIYQVHLNIGTCYLKKDELDKAKFEFEYVLEKALLAHGNYKRDAEATFRAFSGLGEIALKKGDFETARGHFSQALEISPRDEVAAYNVGEVLFSNQQVDEAVKYFELAIQIKKDWSKPYLKLGYAYLNKGDFAKSLENFNAFVQLDPENPEAAQVKNVIAAIEKMKK